MTFLHPDYLWWLLGVPVLAGVLVIALVRARHTLGFLVGTYIREDLLNILTIKHFVVTVFFSVAVSALVVAVAGPQWGEVSVEDERRGLEVVFLVDVSNSMLVDDVSPSRLQRTREVIRAVASRFPGMHHSVVVFKGGSSVLVPMTDDPAAFELAVSNLSPALVTAPGTDLSGALLKAIGAFPQGTPRHRAIVLFSDGGHDEGISTGVLEQVRDSAIPVLAVVAGTPAGGTIPTADGGVLRDSTGEPVIVRVEESRMRRIADISGGALYYLTESNIVPRIAADLEQVGGLGAAVLFRQVTVDRYHLFVLVALLLLTLIVLVQSLRWRGLI